MKIARNALLEHIRIALEDLGLERVAIVYPGAKHYPLGERVDAVPLATLAKPGRFFDPENSA